MDKRKLSIAVISVTALLAVTFVTATPLASKTPLYTYRMEHSSSKMNFLPTAMNDFIYTTERGYTANYGNFTCFECGGGTSPLFLTCNTCDLDLCDQTICATCGGTCPVTCRVPTCPSTCETYTCAETSCPPICPWTEWNQCELTVKYPTCYWETCYWC